MKKFFLFLLISTVALTLFACSSNASLLDGLSKEGIAPYAPSEKDNALLRSFGIDENNSFMISFKVPKGVTAIKSTVYKMENDGKWSITGETSMPLYMGDKSSVDTSGIYTFKIKKDRAFDINMSTKQTRTSYTTEEVMPGLDIATTENAFLEKFQEIEINKEIPVAVMTYDIGELEENPGLEAYFDPSSFEGIVLAQAVTLTFIDEEMK